MYDFILENIYNELNQAQWWLVFHHLSLFLSFFCWIGMCAKVCGWLKDAKDTLDASFKMSWMKDAKLRLPSKDPLNLDVLWWSLMAAEICRLTMHPIPPLVPLHESPARFAGLTPEVNLKHVNRPSWFMVFSYRFQWILIATSFHIHYCIFSL